MPSAARGVINRSIGHSAFRILPTVPQPTSADFIPQITFRIPHFRKLPTPDIIMYRGSLYHRTVALTPAHKSKHARNENDS